MLLPDFSRLSLGPRRRAAPTGTDRDGAALLVEADERKRAASDLADLADDRQEAAKDLVDLPKYHAALAVAGLSTREERDASPEEPRPKKRHERWAEWEVAELKALVRQYGTDWVKITEVWNVRHPDKQRNHGQLSRRGQRMRKDEQAEQSRPVVDEDWTTEEVRYLRGLVRGYEQNPDFKNEGVPWGLIVARVNDKYGRKRDAKTIQEKGQEFLKKARYYGDYGRTSERDREQQREARGRRAQGR